MTTTIEKRVLANALEVYLQVLRGNSIEFAKGCRPYPEVRFEESITSDLSIDRDVCAQEKKA